jgi:hypothetical protein
MEGLHTIMKRSPIERLSYLAFERHDFLRTNTRPQERRYPHSCPDAAIPSWHPILIASEKCNGSGRGDSHGRSEEVRKSSM